MRIRVAYNWSIYRQKSRNFVSNPIVEHRQIALSLQHLAHSVARSTFPDHSGASISLAERIYNILIQKSVCHIYDMHLVLPESADTWKQEIIEFAK